eukprot:5082863-Prorocentrum_lima.AAC.1
MTKNSSLSEGPHKCMLGSTSLRSMVRQLWWSWEHCAALQLWQRWLMVVLWSRRCMRTCSENRICSENKVHDSMRTATASKTSGVDGEPAYRVCATNTH